MPLNFYALHATTGRVASFGYIAPNWLGYLPSRVSFLKTNHSINSLKINQVLQQKN